jgi:hypothetical protein
MKLKYDINNLGDTKKYLNSNYKIGRGKILIGDKVYVHPVVGKSISKEKYQAIILLEKVDWINKQSGLTEPKIEICTYVEGGHASVMNDYLFSRLQKISKKCK